VSTKSHTQKTQYRITVVVSSKQEKSSGVVPRKVWDECVSKNLGDCSPLIEGSVSEQRRTVIARRRTEAFLKYVGCTIEPPWVFFVRETSLRGEMRIVMCAPVVSLLPIRKHCIILEGLPPAADTSRFRECVINELHRL
jgi:hypothetical protein